MDLQIFEYAKYIKYVVWGIVSSGVIVEFTPIKFSPISAILGWIGNKLNRDMKKDIDKLQDEMSTVKTDLRDHKVDSWRNSILCFADDLSHNKKKSKEGYEYIIKAHDNYEKYLSANNLDNGQVTLAYKYIQECYSECLKNNSFYYSN